MSKYLRLWSDSEVEITDPVAVRAEALTFAESVAGDEVGLSPMTDDQAAEWVVRMAVAQALAISEGVRFVGGDTKMRRREGGVYPEFTVPTMPHRRDDGTFVGED